MTSLNYFADSLALHRDPLRKDHSFVVDTASDSSHSHTTPSNSESEKLAAPKLSGDGWSTELSSVSDEEDYDKIKLDPSAVVGGSGGGGLETSQQPGLVNHEKTLASSIMGAEEKPIVDTKMASRGARRQSIQVILEKTSKRGKYVLTADDPEIREILRSGIEREAAKKPRTRFRDLVFTRRFSTFDRQNPLSSESPFYGFFTLFWIAVGLLLVRVAMQNWKTYGSMLGNAEIIHMMLDRDLVVLAVADGVMCGATLFGLGLQRLIHKGYISWAGSGWILQSTWEIFFLGAVVGWTRYRHWPWTHTVFFVLHGLVYLMKQISFAHYNGFRKFVGTQPSFIANGCFSISSVSQKAHA